MNKRFLETEEFETEILDCIEKMFACLIAGMMKDNEEINESNVKAIFISIMIDYFGTGILKKHIEDAKKIYKLFRQDNINGVLNNTEDIDIVKILKDFIENELKSKKGEENEKY